MSQDEGKRLFDRLRRLFRRTVRAVTGRIGGARVTKDGFSLYKYPDYETYRHVQVAGNKSKIERQFVQESHIRLLSAHVDSLLGGTRFGLCHGTRRGAEQAWFSACLAGSPEVIGTEIAETASAFPNTVQWDFHETNPEWSGRADFVYSNSWDHAYDPIKAFGAWIDALRPGGLLLLDHTKSHTPGKSNRLDPFGISFEALEKLLSENFGAAGRLLEPLDLREKNPDYAARVVVFRKNG